MDVFSVCAAVLHSVFKVTTADSEQINCALN